MANGEIAFYLWSNLYDPVSASSSSDSESSSSESDKGESSMSQETKVTQKILSEKEMNELGAKILKLEIMGNKVEYN